LSSVIAGAAMALSSVTLVWREWLQQGPNG